MFTLVKELMAEIWKKLTWYKRNSRQLNSNMSFDMKYGRWLFICQLFINLSFWNQISTVYLIILQCCYILKFLPVLISVYTFPVFLFWYFDFSNRGQVNVLTSQSFDDILSVVYGLKTKQESNTHSHKNQSNSVIYRAILHFSLH